MSTTVRTPECFPRQLWFGSMLVAQAGEPQHDKCPGGHHVEGVIGGWDCPCPCHNADGTYFGKPSLQVSTASEATP